MDIAGNEERYLEMMFYKFCQHPKIRGYLNDESFLTKLEMLVRNPTIVNQLSKADPRIAEAYDIMLLSEEE